MRFLVDEQLPPALAQWIRDGGHDALHVEEAGLGSASDVALWSFARREGFVIVSKDSDFAMRRRQIEGPAILWLRIGNATTRGLLARIESEWENALGFLAAGEPIVEI